MKTYFIYAACLLIIACNSVDKTAKMDEQQKGSSTKSSHSDSVNQSFSRVLSDYYALKDNFIAENDSFINKTAKKLILSVDSLHIDAFIADSNIVATANTFILGISAELIGLAEEKQIEAKRKSFQIVSDQLYNLIRTVQYDQAVVYHLFCPTAFSDQGAYWLSNSSIDKNPYNPNKKPSCREVKDSINFMLKN
jgi:hypothetical protein